jgi:hypothetical protein
VNIEKDFSGDPLGGDYILTPTAREALHRLIEGLEASASCRAWTITGPYGVGKSAFAVFVSQLFCGRDLLRNKARKQLRECDPILAGEVDDLPVSLPGALGMLPILITARRAPASLCLVEGIATSLSLCQNQMLKSVARRVSTLIARTDEIDSRRVVDALGDVTTAAKDAGYTGVLLVVDEIGKLFEFAARDSQRGDVFVLQEVAEQAARSGSIPILFLGLLHQAFEEYGRHLDMVTRREWAKIHGRFEDISFIEPVEQVIRMIQSAIQWREPMPETVKAKLRNLAKVATHCGAVPPGMKSKAFEETVVHCYPLHPLVVVALPYLFRRFAQNERSLFSYLSSMEPGGLQDFLRTHELDPQNPPFVRLEQLFDYFTGNFGAGLYRQPHARRWLEASDALERHTDLSDLHQRLVKSIGILNAMGEFCHLGAGEMVISCALDDSATPKFETGKALQELRERSLLTYRRFNNSYRIWEGSDVDIEERVAEGERKLRYSMGLADSVKQYLSMRPLVARRHSFETGALRFFELRYIDDSCGINYRDVPKDGADGQVLVCLYESAAAAESFRKAALAATDRRDVIFAIPQQIGELRATALELTSLRWVWENTPELRDDRVARRELALRITDAEQILRRCMEGLLDPRPENVGGSGCLWFCAGKEYITRMPSDVSQLLSTICDNLYTLTPRVRNELISRRVLSSAAVSARRNLIEAMLLNGERPLLGIEGYPPERSMYESVLLSTGLHRQLEGGTWGFQEPVIKDKLNLRPCWEFLLNNVFQEDSELNRLDELFGRLSKNPYGVIDGLHPVLLCAFLLVYADEITLYREGTFLPEPSVADFEVLMRRPELFAVAGCRVAGGRAAVIDRLASGLSVKAATVPVVRALFKMVRSLPEYAWKTRHLSERTLALRDAFVSARSPERFIFDSVPKSLGVMDFGTNNASAEETELFFCLLNESLQEWSACANKALDTTRDILLEACGLPKGVAGWETLRAQALRLESIVTNSQLLTFVRRVNQSGSGSEGIESVLGLIAGRPPGCWGDEDVSSFSDAVEVVAKAFLEACGGESLDSNRFGLHDLGSLERKQAEALIARIRDELADVWQHKSRRVVRAALLEVVRQIENQKR